MTYRAEIQGLRALAVLLVIGAHSGVSWVPGGFIGVDVFFVISGYLITGLLFSEYDRSGSLNLANFYSRRLMRLLPALSIMVATTCLGALALLPQSDFATQTGSAPFVMLWASNIYFAIAQFSYFDELHNLDLFIHTWSLGVEEQFYLLWPLALLFFMRRGNSSRSFHGFLLLAAVASFTSMLILMRVDANLAFYLMPTRIWQFAIGGLIFLERDRLILFSIKYLPAKNVIGIATILISAFLLSADHAYPGVYAVGPTLGAALILLSARKSQSDIITRALSSKSLKWIGDRSYSIYLWHWPITAFCLSEYSTISTSLVLIILICSLFFGALSYTFVEQPFRKGRVINWANNRTLSLALLVMLTLGVGSKLLLDFRSGQSVPSVTKDLAELRMDMPRIYSDGCDSWYESAAVVPCMYGQSDAQKTIVLFGDSKLGQWFSAIAENYPSPEWQIAVITKSACPMVDVDFFYKRIGRIYERCSRWRNDALELLYRLKADVIVTGSARYGFSEEDFVNGSSRIFDKLSQSAPNVFVLMNNPSLGFDGPSCLIKAAEDGGERSPGETHRCSAPAVDGKVIQTLRYLKKATESYDNVMLIPVSKLVCPDRVCSAVNDEGIAVFRDGSHISDSFARSKAYELANQFRLALENGR